MRPCRNIEFFRTSRMSLSLALSHKCRALQCRSIDRTMPQATLPTHNLCGMDNWHSKSSALTSLYHFGAHSGVSVACNCVATLVICLHEVGCVIFHCFQPQLGMPLLRRSHCCCNVPARLPATVHCNGTLPPAPANSTAFPGGCRGLPGGAVCRTNCTRGFAGTITTSCGSGGSWSAPTGTCSLGECCHTMLASWAGTRPQCSYPMHIGCHPV